MHHLDMIQHSAARLCFNNYSKEPGVVTDMFNKLEWPSLKGRRILSQLSMFHQIVYHTVGREHFQISYRGPSYKQVSPQNKLTQSNSLSHG